jgi:hypothetical protein
MLFGYQIFGVVYQNFMIKYQIHMEIANLYALYQIYVNIIISLG